MPIIDGINSTKIIRQSEQECLPNGMPPSRVPIFAVSASLLEKDRQLYIESGFDGWIMKPIDIHRVDFLLCGVRQGDVREQSSYRPGMWENGGWFEGA